MSSSNVCLFDLSDLTRADEKPGQEDCHSNGTDARRAHYEWMRHRLVSERLEVSAD